MNLDHAIALLAPGLLRRQGQVFRDCEAGRSGRSQAMAKDLIATSAGRSAAAISWIEYWDRNRERFRPTAHLSSPPKRTSLELEPVAGFGRKLRFRFRALGQRSGRSCVP
jgi:hypothetical protein